MPFGLFNAPSTFMCLMIEVLRPFLGISVVHFNNILIDNKSTAEHLHRVSEVVQALDYHELPIQQVCLSGTIS